MEKELLERINKIIDKQIEKATEMKEKAELPEVKNYFRGRADSLELLKIDLIAIL